MEEPDTPQRSRIGVPSAERTVPPVRDRGTLLRGYSTVLEPVVPRRPGPQSAAHAAGGCFFAPSRSSSTTVSTNHWTRCTGPFAMSTVVCPLRAIAVTSLSCFAIRKPVPQWPDGQPPRKGAKGQGHKSETLSRRNEADRQTDHACRDQQLCCPEPAHPWLHSNAPPKIRARGQTRPGLVMRDFSAVRPRPPVGGLHLTAH